LIPVFDFREEKEPDARDAVLALIVIRSDDWWEGEGYGFTL